MINKKQDKPVICDSCHKSVKKIHRRYENKGYCTNCYQVYFKLTPCHKCGKSYRFHIDSNKHICPDCRRHQPCIRCGKDAFINGSTTEYGRVCQTCKFRYFSEEKKCFKCGEIKKGVRPYSTVGHSQPICQSCYQNHFNETCPCCHKHRKLIDTENGKMCKKCHEFGKIPCPKCQNLMWAGMGKQCHACYLQQKLDKKVAVTKYLFKSEKIRQDYETFNDWFSEKKGLHQANVKFTNFLDFFAKCDELWGEIPSYEDLVKEFKSEGLKTYLTVQRWLLDTKRITIDKTIKEHIAEEERITNLFTKLSESTPSYIQKYYDYLLKRQAKRGTALKTVRLALQPVIDIYESNKLTDNQTPNQANIDNYLKTKPGQLNCLSSFIVFLREQQDITLEAKVSSPNITKKQRRKELEKNMLDFMNTKKSLDTKQQIQWLQMTMEYFHEITVPLKELKKLSTSLDGTGEMMVLSYQGQDYHLPKFEQETA